MGQRYRENFATDPGGWWGWESNSAGPRALEHSPGTLTSRSPWWIDYNHAPPGAGYLHMLFCTYTRGPIGEYHREVGGPHRLLEGGFPSDYTHARITLRLKGELRPQGTQLVFLAQATVGEITSCWSLTGQPLTVSSDWSEQTITLLQSAARQLLDGAGLTVERPLEGLDIPTAYRLMDLVHFRRVRQAIAGKDTTTFTDRMECAHIISDSQLVFYNRVHRPASETDA